MSCKAELEQACLLGAYLDDIGSPRIFRADARNSDSFTKPLDEMVLQCVHLLEIWVEVRHRVESFVEVGPGGVRYAIRRVFVQASWSSSEALSRHRRSEASTNTERAYSRWISRCRLGRWPCARECLCSLQKGVEGQAGHVGNGFGRNTVSTEQRLEAKFHLGRTRSDPH
jgi:hypothetical protein